MFLLFVYLFVVKGGGCILPNGSSPSILSWYVRATIHLYYNKTLEHAAVAGRSVGTR